MSKRPFVLGVLTGLVLTLALGFGALTLAGGTSAAGTSLRFGDAVRGALARRDASPATGSLAIQSTDAETDAATDSTTDGEEAEGDWTASKRAVPASKIISKALPVPHTFTRAINIDDEPGVLVAGVEPESAAAVAGLARGDVITAIDGEPVEHMGDLHERLMEAGAGETVALSVMHGDEARELSVTLDEDASTGLLGFAPCGGGMAMIAPAMELHHLEMMDEKAYVSGVEAGSAAEAAGLAEGDVITAIDGVAVETTDALATAIGERAPGETVALTVESAEGEAREVSATLGEHPDDPARGFLGVMLGQTISIESGMLPEGMFELPGDGQWFGEGGMLPFDMSGHGGELHFELGDGPGMFDLESLEALAVDGVLSGALVHDFTGDGPAADAGLIEGDVITAIDGEPVDGAETLVSVLEGRVPGETLSLTVARKGETELLTIPATLGARPEDETAGWLGVEVGTLEMRLDGEGGVDHGFHMGDIHEHLRDLLRHDDDGEEAEDGTHRFRFRIGPGGDSDGETGDAVELDLGGEA